MSSIEENAFQIARYLADNNHTSINKVKKGDVRNVLGLSPEDFHNAVVYLSSQGYCTAGLGGDTDSIWIKSPGISFVKNEMKERVNLSLNAEILLKYLMRNQTPDFPYSLVEPIMKHFSWNEDRYMQVAQELSDNDFVQGNYADGNPFFKISLLPKGRRIVRTNFHLPNLSQGPLQIVGNNNIVSISSTLNSVNQFIQANSIVESSSKQELEKLLQELESALKEVPDENGDDAEAVANMAKNLIENATREKPNKPLVQISAEGLKKAAENIATIAPKVLLTAQAIIVFIKSLYPSLLP
jgi:hypothetical protein